MRWRFYFISGMILIIFFGLIGIGVSRDMNWIITKDELGSQLIRSNMTDFRTSFFLTMTRFGDYVVVAILTGVMTLLLFISKQRVMAVWFALTMAICGGVIPYVLKRMIMRARPSDGLIERTGYSFPSGHATGATIFYGLLIVLALCFLKKRWQRGLVILGNCLLVMIIMSSRVYLGVHFTSDVIASVVLGSGLILWANAAYVYCDQNRHQNVINRAD